MVPKGPPVGPKDLLGGLADRLAGPEDHLAKKGSDPHRITRRRANREPLFTELPRRALPGNAVAANADSRKLSGTEKALGVDSRGLLKVFGCPYLTRRF